MTDKYAMLTPYQFASNKPITSIDLDGLESYVVISMPQEDGKTKLITKSWKELGKKEIHGGKGMGVSFYNYDPKTKKAVFQEFKNFNQLGMGPKESVKRDAGLALESFGEAVEMGGYFVNIIPHPLAKVLGAGLQAGGEASQLLGTSLQVSADLDDENYGEVGFTVSKTLLFGGLKKTVGNLKEQGKISGNDETILNGLLFGNEKVVDKFNSVAKKKSSESSSSQSATPSNSKESTSNSDLNIQVDE
ncbi:MAG: hypothetical protein KFKLKKLM_02441 [Flavobacteriales bacterium]|nr:hypothetical protein [Flavobacteriales bacterium]